MPTDENKSDFLTLQQDVCKKPPDVPEEKDKICPTCVPNPNYLEPVPWYDSTEPYLNEKTCEYMIGVTVNKYGNTNLDGSQYTQGGWNLFVICWDWDGNLIFYIKI